MLSIDGKKVSDYKAKGLTILIDGKMPADNFKLTAGEHTFAIKEMPDVKPVTFGIRYDVVSAIRNNNTYGWTREAGTVLQKCADIYQQIITDQMTDEQKISAIHDYLIYHANYTANGDMTQVSDWHHSIGGLVMDGSGVCSAYALTFYTLAKAAGLDCLYEAGHTVGTDAGSHAWNKVKVNGEWYYIDCTWDDPIGGGQENRQYYLSKTLWSDHVMEEDINYLGEYKYNADGWTSLLAGDKNRYPARDNKQS